MADVAATVERVNLGNSDNNHRFLHARRASVINGDVMTVDCSSIIELAPSSQPFVPSMVSIYTDDNAAVGARAHIGGVATLTWAYNEATRLMRITNGSGGTLHINVYAMFLPATI